MPREDGKLQKKVSFQAAEEVERFVKGQEDLAVNR